MDDRDQILSRALSLFERAPSHEIRKLIDSWRDVRTFVSFETKESLDPRYETIFLKAAKFFLQQGDLANAVAAAEDLRLVSLDHPEADYLFAVARARWGAPYDVAARARRIQDSTKVKRLLAVAHLRQGERDLKSGRLNTALTEFDLALAQVETFMDALKAKAEALLRLNLHKDAKAVVKKLLEFGPTGQNWDSLLIEPFSAYDFFELGFNLDESNLTEEAKSCYRAALRLEPDDAASSFNLALLEIKCSHYHEAIERLETYMIRHGDRSLGLAYRGEAKHLMGEESAARLDFEAALEIDPENSVAKRGLAKLDE